MSNRRQQRKRCDSSCRDHIFNFKPVDSQSRFEIELQFCPKYMRQPLPAEQTHPIFNNDKRYYTSGFILGVERRALKQNLQHQIMTHQKMIKESLEKNNQQVTIPRPNMKLNKQPNCSVCRTHYVNYYGHIASEQHRNVIGENLYNGFLLDLCEGYRELWDGAEERAENLSDQSFISEEEEGDDNSPLQDQSQDGQSNRSGQDQGEIQLQSQQQISFKQKQKVTTGAKRVGTPLLADLLSKKIIVTKGELIKPVSVKSNVFGKETERIASPLLKTKLKEKEKEKDGERSSYMKHREKYFSRSPENGHNTHQKEDSHTVQNRSVNPVQQNYERYEETHRNSTPFPIYKPENLQHKQKDIPFQSRYVRDGNQKNMTPVQYKKTEIEPYQDYLRKMHERNCPPSMGYPGHPTISPSQHQQHQPPQLYNMYQQHWPYPYYPQQNMAPPVGMVSSGGPTQPASSSGTIREPIVQPKNSYIGNTSININFPMYMPTYPSMFSPTGRYPPGYPNQHQHYQPPPHPQSYMPHNPQHQGYSVDGKKSEHSQEQGQRQIHSPKK